MRVGEHILRRLAREGVTHVFGVYGSAVGDLVDAFHRVPEIKFVTTAHEQGAGFMAEGYAKATGRIGVALSTSGPGATNLLTPIANCYHDSVPCLFLTGQVATPFQRKPYSGLRAVGFQEVDIVAMARPVTLFAEMVASGERLVEALDVALDTMRRGRPGPALLDIPLDVAKRDVDDQATPSLPWRELGFRAVSEPVAATLTALRAAARPLVIVGGGCRGLGRELEIFARKWNVPLVPTWNALDLVPADQPFFGGTLGTYGGGIGRNFAVQQADFVLLLGCRVSGRLTGGAVSTFLRGAKTKIHVDLDLAVLHESPIAATTQRFRCDVGTFLRALNGRVTEDIARYVSWMEQVREWRDRYDGVREMANRTAEAINPYTFVRALSDNAPANAIITAECGGDVVTMHQAWRTKTGQRFFSNHGFSPMGGGLSYGIGAAFGTPDRPVICVVGDGGLSMSAMELLTLSTYREALRTLRVFVLNNRCLGITKQWQATNYPKSPPIACGPERETGYEAPDFVKIAQAYGIEAHRIGGGATSTALSCALRDALVLPGPLLVDVDCRGWATYEPRISGFDQPIEESWPSLPEDEFLAAMKYLAPIPGWRERRSG